VVEPRENCGCDGCSESGVPLLETSDGRSLCITCIEADPNHAGVERQAVGMLRVLTRQAQGLGVRRVQARGASKLN